jgi:tetratricopeptide (TPR) repeat protein
MTGDAVKGYFLLFVFSFVVYLGNSQDPKCYIKLRGITEENLNPANGVNIKLFEGDKVVSEINTDFKGDFEFKLDTGKYYTIVFAKPGFVSKKLAYDTKVPSGESMIWTNDCAVTMVKDCEGVDLSALNKPIDEIKYHERSRSFKSDNEYARKMFRELDIIYFELENCHYDNYKKIISKADDAYKKGNLEMARDKYREASEMFMAEEYPRKRMYEVINELKELNKHSETFEALVEAGDLFFQQEKYKEALGKYEQANGLIQGNAELAQKISVTREKLHEQLIQQNKDQLAAQKQARADRAQFELLLGQADEQFKNKDYIQAKTNYEKALSLSPGDAYISARLSRLETLAAKQQEEERAASLQQQQQMQAQKQKENQFIALLEQGDNLLALNELGASKEKYEQALQVKPGDQTVLLKLQQVDQKIEHKRLQQMAVAEKKQQFDQAVALAKSFLQNNQIEQALAAFKKAQQVMPNDAYVKQNITNLEQKAQQQKLAEQQQQETNRLYGQHIAEADRLLSSGQHQQAKLTYQKALEAKPGDSYAISKISETNTAIQQQLQAENEQQQRESQYLSHMNTAQKWAQQNNLNAARLEYQKALNLKPSDPVASAQLKSIEQLIQQQQNQQEVKRQQEMAYQDQIRKADGLFKNGEMEAALAEYRIALNHKPNDTYTNNQIVLINNKIAESQKDMATQQQYEMALKQGNSLFNRGDLNNARTFYEQALALQPDSKYPLQQLEEIERRQNAMALNTVAAKESKTQLHELKFKNTQEKENYLRNLVRKYPDGITLEVYTEKFRTTNRYIIIREGEANEYREVINKNGGREHFINDKAVNNMYFNQQTKKREGEYFRKIDM